MWRSQEKILAQKVNEKFFTVDPYWMGKRVLLTFRISRVCGKLRNLKKIFPLAVVNLWGIFRGKYGLF